jgi:hypothetical protein
VARADRFEAFGGYCTLEIFFPTLTNSMIILNSALQDISELYLVLLYFILK